MNEQNRQREEVKQAYESLQYPGDLAADIEQRQAQVKAIAPKRKRRWLPWTAGLAAAIVVAMWFGPDGSKTPTQPSPVGPGTSAQKMSTPSRRPGMPDQLPATPKYAVHDMPKLSSMEKRIPSVHRMPKVSLSRRQHSKSTNPKENS